MKTLVFLFILSLLSCGDDSVISKKDERLQFFNQIFTIALLSGIIDTAPDLCGEDRSRSTLISSGFTASGNLTDTIRSVYYRVIEESNVIHSIKFQTLSTNCSIIGIRFDDCKSNRRNGNIQLQCNFPTDFGSSGYNGLVRISNGIQSVECIVKSFPGLSIIKLANGADTTTGGCQWSLQYTKN